MPNNTQTIEEYLEKQKRLFKEELKKKNFLKARSHLHRIDNLEAHIYMDEPDKIVKHRGDIRPCLPSPAPKGPNRAERRKGMTMRSRAEKPADVVKVEAPNEAPKSN